MPDTTTPSKVETMSDALTALSLVTQSLKSKTLVEPPTDPHQPGELSSGGSIDVSINAVMTCVATLRRIDSELSKLGIYDRG